MISSQWFPCMMSLPVPWHVPALGRAVKEGQVERPSPTWPRRNVGSERGLAWPLVTQASHDGAEGPIGWHCSPTTSPVLGPAAVSREGRLRWGRWREQCGAQGLTREGTLRRGTRTVSSPVWCPRPSFSHGASLVTSPVGARGRARRWGSTSLGSRGDSVLSPQPCPSLTWAVSPSWAAWAQNLRLLQC